MLSEVCEELVRDFCGEAGKETLLSDVQLEVSDMWNLW